jgi:hypothetical protein
MNSKWHSESLGNYGNSFAAFPASDFLLPQSVSRCRKFESRSASIIRRRSIFANRSSLHVSRASGSICGSSRRDRGSSKWAGSRSGLGIGSSTLKTRSSVGTDRSSGITSRSSERHRPPPFSKTAPPPGRASRLLSNLLLQSSLQLK